jgi:hypothetical protein
MNVRKLREDIKSIANTDITKGEYEDRVDDLAEHVLNGFPEDVPIEERIWEVANNSPMVLNPEEMAAPIIHGKNEPPEIGIYTENSGVSGIAFAHLQADIMEKVVKKQNSSSTQGGDRDE